MSKRLLVLQSTLADKHEPGRILEIRRCRSCGQTFGHRRPPNDLTTGETWGACDCVTSRRNLQAAELVERIEPPDDGRVYCPGCGRSNSVSPSYENYYCATCGQEFASEGAD